MSMVRPTSSLVKDEAKGSRGFDEETIIQQFPSQSNDPVPTSTAKCHVEPINEANLFELPSEQASKLNFPVGCPVWYNKCNSRQTESNNNRFDVRHGTVIAALIDVMSRKCYYRIEKTGNINDMSDAPDVASKIDVVLEDRIAYAAKCPVIVQTDADKELDGEIICPQSVTSGDDNVITAYTIMLFLNDNILRVEDGIAPDQVKFRNTKEIVMEHEETDIGEVQVLHFPGLNGSKNDTTINISANGSHSDKQIELTNSSGSVEGSRQKYVKVITLETSISSVTEATQISRPSLDSPLPKKRNIALANSETSDTDERPQKLAKRIPRKIPRKSSQSNTTTKTGTGAPDSGDPGNNSGGIKHVLFKNLPLDLSEHTFRAFLNHHSIVKIEYDTDTMGKFLGSSIVELQTHNDATNLVQEKDGALLDGNLVTAKLFSDKPGQQSPWRKNRNYTQESIGEAHFYNAKGCRPMRDKPNGCKALFLGNLSCEASEEGLRNLFLRVAVRPKALRFPDNHQNGSRKPYAFADFWDEDDCERAAKLNGTEFCGRPINIDWEIPKRNNSAKQVSNQL